ncbi:hypothetical protein AGMMS49975_18210 [Clostridia bacterium]|nr:hypothetical protein AGMMS49975_18210 [Clostridia bacterium]
MYMHLYKISTVILICILVLLSGCTSQGFADNKSLSQSYGTITEEDFKERLVAGLFEKYDKHFEISDISSMNDRYCEYRGIGTSIDDRNSFSFWAAFYNDGTLNFRDSYFQYVIKEDYEKYMSDIVSEVYPENKVIMQHASYYSFWDGYDKNSTFEDVVRDHNKELKNAIKFNICIHTEGSGSEKQEIAQKIAKHIYDNSDFGASIYIIGVRNNAENGYEQIDTGNNNFVIWRESQEWSGDIRMEREFQRWSISDLKDIVDGEAVPNSGGIIYGN